VFYVAAPALLFTTVAEADVGDVLSVGLVVAGVSASFCLIAYMLIARLAWGQSLGDGLFGGWASSYVNAGNLGIPVAVYAFGDATYTAPVLLFQIVVLAPLGFAILDATSTDNENAPPLARRLVQPFANPILIGTTAGLITSAADWTPPLVVGETLDLLAGLAVPGALIAFGISLGMEPWPGIRRLGRRVALATVLKLLVHPMVAYVVARFVFGVGGTELVAITAFGALPTAAHVFVYAVKYDREVALARHSILVTTILSVPVITVIAALIG